MPLETTLMRFALYLISLFGIIAVLVTLAELGPHITQTPGLD
jgi:hypothetical protein